MTHRGFPARLLRVLLVLAPSEFRDRYGEELLETSHLRVAAAAGGKVGRTLRAVVELAGLAVTVVRLRVKRPERFSPLRSSWQDLHFAVRSLRRNPKFAVAAVLVIAMGVGATTAIFSAVNAYLFRPLPFGHSENVLMLFETNPGFGWTHANCAPANVLDWRERVGSFSDVAAYNTWVAEAPYLAQGEPDLLRGTEVTGNYFSVLGVHMHLGRGFLWNETWDGDDAVIVLSHGLWTSHFGGDPDIVGKTVQLGTRGREIVGVAPKGFKYPTDQTEYWVPVGWSREARDRAWFRRAHMVRAVARLAVGSSYQLANADFQTVVRQLQTEYPETNRVMGAGMMRIRDFLIREIRRPLLILMASVAVLLLLSCVNVANLMLLRGDDRGREIALRYALGAGRARIIRLMIMESLSLAVVGGVVGMGLGWTGVRLLEHLNRLGIEGATGLALDARVVAFAAATSAASGALFGLLPSLRATSRGIGEALRDSGRASTLGRGGMRTTNALVMSEVALAFILVAGAALMVRSFWALRNVDPGFATESVLGVSFTIPSSRYSARNDVLTFHDRIVELLEARPGIERVGGVGRLPLMGTSWSSQFQAEGWPPDRVGFEILHRRADRGYFEALDIPLLRGRLFEPTDRPDGPLVVVINETFGREHFPGEDPIGQRIAYDRNATAESTWYEIVGIVGDQHQVSPGVPARAEVFEYLKQDWNRTNWLIVKTTLPTREAMAQTRAVLKEMDPLIPIAEAHTLEEVWSNSMSQEQFLLTVLAGFGALALLLATVGVYTVVAQAARRRSREIGIRMALGATGRSVLSLVFNRGVLVVGAGLGIGLGVTVATSRMIASQLFQIEPTDPSTLVTVVVVLGGVATLACYLPARRASRAHPLKTLRSE